MSRKVALAVALLGVIAASAGCVKKPVPQDTAADKQKLETDALSWFDKFAAADSEGVANLYADDAILLPPNAHAVNGRAAIRSYLGAMAEQVKAGHMALKQGTSLGADVSGDMGWVAGTYTFEDSTGAKIDEGKYMSVHHRVDGQWLYVRDTWNSDLPAAPAAPAHAKGAKK